LTNADLQYAHLQNAHFEFAHLGNANFEDANVGPGTEFSNSYWHQTIWTDGVRYDSNQA
jgi:uncharacterized protein YjbI with pentapeptide repeats